MKKYSLVLTSILITFSLIRAQMGEPIHIERSNGSSWAHVNKPGTYYLTGDVDQLSVQGEDISIDLNGYAVTGNTTQFALMIDNANSVKLYNGTVYHAQLYAIRVYSSKSVELHHLSIKKQPQTLLPILEASIGAFHSEDLNLYDLHFIEDDGKCALKFVNCKNLDVRACNIEGFLSSKATIYLTKCIQVHIQDIDAYAQQADNAEDVGWSLVCKACENADFQGVRFNHAQKASA